MMTQDDMFALYALEMDGKLDTHFSKVRKLAFLLRDGVEIGTALFRTGLYDDDLTEDDMIYISNVLGED